MARRFHLARRLTALAALGLALGAATARAQAPPDEPIRMPDGRSIPTIFLRAPIEPDPITGRLPRNAPRTAWAVWMAYADYRPRARWDSKPETPAAFGGQPLAFLQKCYVLEIRQEGGHEYLLLATGRPRADLTGVTQPLGWVPRDYVVDSTRAQAAGAGGVLAKAMLINDVEQPEALVGKGQVFLDAIWAQGVPAPLDDPKKQAAYRRKQYALFNIFWIFARTPYGPITSSAPDRDQAWILIGNTPGITANADGTDDAAAVIQGWVPETRALLWLTREGLAWDRISTLPGAVDRRQARGLIYRTADEAYAASYPALFAEKTGQKAAGVPITVGEETMVANPEGGWVSAGYQPHHMRMPRLEWPRAGLNSKEVTRFLPSESGDNELIRIGSISGFDGLSAEKIADRGKLLDMIAQELETTEILIVIDDTISMAKYFEAVAQAVERIQADAVGFGERVKAGGGKPPMIRAAVSYYNDTDGRPLGSRPYETMALRPIADFGASIARSVRDHKPNNGGDIPEMVFAGLGQAIGDARFSPFSRKLVFLIGDARDKSEPDDPVPVETVGRLFRPSGDSPIEFIAIQTLPSGQSDDAAGFEKQTARLAGYLNKNRGPNLRKLGTTLPLEGRDLDELISKGYEGVRADAERKRREIDAIRAGDFNTELSEDTRKVLKRRGIDVDEIRRNSNGKFQVYRAGYLWRLPKEKDGSLGAVPQVRDVVLLNRFEVLTLVDSLNKLVEFHDQRKTGSSTKEALRDLILALIGDMYPKDDPADEKDPKAKKDPNPLGLTFQEAMRRKIGLSLKSSFLQAIPRDGQVDISFQSIEDIVWKVQKLKDVVEGVERDWSSQQINEVDVHVPGAGKRQNARGFTIPGSPALWYWLDAEDEIP